MNGNTDQRGLRVVKASYPRVRLCVCGGKKEARRHVYLCANAPCWCIIYVLLLFLCTFTFTCAERRCWLSERFFVQYHMLWGFDLCQRRTDFRKGEKEGGDRQGRGRRGVKGKVKREKKLFLEKCVRSVGCDATGRGREEECFRF